MNVILAAIIFFWFVNNQDPLFQMTLSGYLILTHKLKSVWN